VTDLVDTVGRVVAFAARRAVPVRATSALAVDPVSPFGIAFVRVVAEQRVQAIAYGSVDADPAFALILNPLGRESQELEAFAAALADYVDTMLARRVIPRIWVGHQAAVELLEILGHRYRTNPNASPAVRRMGGLCHALAQEVQFPGQQVVAVAGNLFTSHVVTGQSPKEDQHLAATLAWIAPPAGTDPEIAANALSLVPANAMLRREDDDRVESQRLVAKGEGPRAAAAREEITAMLRAGARYEWDLLVAGRRAFWGLGLTTPAALEELVGRSYDRVAYSLPNMPAAPTSPHALSRRLASIEDAADLQEDVEARTDPVARERLRAKGRVVGATVVRIDQPVRGRRPCRLVLLALQGVLRLRRGVRLKLEDGRVSGIVQALRENAGGPGRLVYLTVTKGVRSVPGPGQVVELYDTRNTDYSFRRNSSLRDMQANASPLVYGTPMPAARRRPVTGLKDFARGLRR
jgi:hypothetical protein